MELSNFPFLGPIIELFLATLGQLHTAPKKGGVQTDQSARKDAGRLGSTQHAGQYSCERSGNGRILQFRKQFHEWMELEGEEDTCKAVNSHALRS